MPVRRHADPNNLQYIWDSIKSANAEHQPAELSNIIKFLQSETYCSSSQAELYISQALKDELIVKTDSKVVKPPNAPDHYRIPTDELTTPYDDGKDWYCIECHLAGDVTACKNCHRVFHPECSRNVRYKQVVFQTIEKCYQKFKSPSDVSQLTDTSKEIVLNQEPANIVKVDDIDSKEGTDIGIFNFENFAYSESICSICNLHRIEGRSEFGKEELNHLLKFILDRIRSWLPSNLTHTMAPGQKYEWNDEADLSWRATQLFYQHVNMSVMDLKLQSQEYSKIIEFIADVITIQHNVAVFHGTESQEYGAAELMIRDTCHDVTELKTCIDCYRHSNEKINSNWFCLPCRKPHALVWAKQKGYPFWPAKIIKETDTVYDVRFFGAKYERSILPKNKKNILPIEVRPKNHEIKKSPAFNKALEELKLHQHLLRNPNALNKYITRQVQTVVQKQPKSAEKKIVERKKPGPKPKSLSQDQPAKKPENSEKPGDPGGSKKQAVKRRSTRSGAESTPSKVRKSTSTAEKEQSPPKPTVQEIIPISDAEEDEFLALDHYSITRSDGCYGQVSSSTEYFISHDDSFHTADVSDMMHPLEQPYSDAVEKMRRKLEQVKDKKQLINVAMDCMQQEIDRITNDHNEHLKRLFDAHQVQISETKKKQWCYNCEQDAIYHCCWNTAYCSPQCQQQHWQAEHKKVCRRKR